MDQTFGRDRITKQWQFISEPNLINLSSFGVDIREKISQKDTHIKSTNPLKCPLHKYCNAFAQILQKLCTISAKQICRISATDDIV